MATQACADCGKEVSENAEKCPHCGADGPKEKEEFPLMLYIVGVIIAPLVVVFLLGMAGAL